MTEIVSEIDAMTVNDYVYCEDCREFVDFWKYKDLEDAGHEGHMVRNVTHSRAKGVRRRLQRRERLLYGLSRVSRPRRIERETQGA